MKPRPFDIHKYQQHKNDEKVQKLVEQAEAHHTAMREGAQRHHARIAQYSNGDLGDIVDYVTQSLASPKFQREWKKVIEDGQAGGFSGLNRSEAYRDFQNQTGEYLRGLGPDFEGTRQNLMDALRPENMTHFLGDRISSTDPNPRGTLHKLLAEHINPKDEQALRDRDLSERHRQHLLREDGYAPHFQASRQP